ncbi:hypothetical protein EDD86DRAFT_214731 [Gorgonomyces haynaldii]|nr:hypothetical protein EDD86DRAFT_214731 [Gorgonomyces haynaldii]
MSERSAPDNASLLSFRSNRTRYSGTSRFSAAGPLNPTSYGNILNASQLKQLSSKKASKGFLGFSFGKKKSTERLTSGMVADLTRPFRFVPAVEDEGESERQNACMAFVKEETEYGVLLAQATKTLEEHPSLGLGRVLVQFKELQLSSSELVKGDTAVDTIVAKIASIVPPVYESYLYNFDRLSQDIQAIVSHDQKQAFEIEEVGKSLYKPLQRLLDYRFFLRRIMTSYPVIWPGAAELDTAITHLSAVCTKMLEHFQITDSFAKVSALEDALHKHCRPLGQVETDEQMDILTFLTAPFYQNHIFWTCPDVIGTGNFAVYPVSKDVQINKWKQNVKRTMKKGTMQFVHLVLLTDTLLLLEETAGQRKLLYPPMPLSHIDISPRADMEGVFELRLSPYQMVILVGTEQIDNDLIQTLLKLKEKPQPLEPSVSEKTLKSDTETEKKSDAQYRIYYQICRPHVYKTETTSWEKLSKCHLAVFKDEKSWLQLTMEDTGMLLWTTNIDMMIQAQIDSNSPMRVIVSAPNPEGSLVKYLFRFLTAEAAHDLVNMIAFEKIKALRMVQQEYSDQLLIQENVNWNCPSVKIDTLGLHSKANLRINKLLIPTGPVYTKLEHRGPDGKFISTRLVIHSSTSRKIEWLNLELYKDSFAIQTKQDVLSIRFFWDNKQCDFELKDAEELSEMLKRACKRVEKTYQDTHQSLQALDEAMNDLVLEKSPLKKPVDTKDTELRFLFEERVQIHRDNQILFQKLRQAVLRNHELQQSIEVLSKKRKLQ